MITFTFPYLDQRVFTTTIVVLICFSPNRHSIAPMPQTPKAFQFPSESGTVKAPFFIGILQHSLDVVVVVVQLLA